MSEVPEMPRALSFVRLALLWLIIGIAFFVGFVTGRQYEQAQQPECPTEDSCTVDYRDGQWFIEPTNP